MGIEYLYNNYYLLSLKSLTQVKGTTAGIVGKPKETVAAFVIYLI